MLNNKQFAYYSNSEESNAKDRSPNPRHTPEPDPNRMNEFGCFSVSFSIIKIILMKVEQIKYASIELLVFNKIIFSFQNLLLNSLKLGFGIELLSDLAAPTAETDFNLI